MRRAARVDRNHAEIRDGLRAVTDVEDTHCLGDGFPDLIARHLGTGHGVMLEVKDPLQPPNKRRLTPGEAEIQRRWGPRGYAVVMTLDDAFRAVGAL